MPLTDEQRILRDELRGHVEALAALGERSVFKPEKLAAAAVYIGKALSQDGYTVRAQPYRVGRETCRNLEVGVAGTARPGEIVVVGAHYDSVPGSPGANDNASGVSATLSLARRFRASAPRRTLRFVAFVNEEPPHFQTEAMGSLVYARAARQRGDNIVAMLSLETIGYYSDAPGSQKYPALMGLLYPSTGRFIGFVANIASRRLLRDCVWRFRSQVSFPCEGAVLPAATPGAGWSDHWAFWQEGYPALMVTDTAPFRYPHYHAAEDTPDKLDYDRMTQVVDGLVKVVDWLVNR